MQFSRSDADVFVPSGGDAVAALGRVTHLCVGAHQDDVEIMAHRAICDCLDHPDEFAFGGVVVTNGGGSSRTGPYAEKTDTEMQAIRREEQRQAASLGGYAVQIQLGHPSLVVKAPTTSDVVDDLAQIFAGCSPREVILHNPLDKHDTHIAVLLRCLTALRRLPPELRPARVLGVEVWRGLEWLLNTDKLAQDTSRRPELRRRLLKVFDSQITGGKRYDLATEGRQLANATYHDSHASDDLSALAWAMDLTPLLANPELDVAMFTLGYVDRLREDVADRLHRFQP